MIATVKILAILCCMVLLTRRKVSVGYVLLMNSALAAVLFRMNLKDALKAMGAGAFLLETLQLVGIIVLIMSMGEIMRAVKSFDRTMESLELLLRDTRAVMAAIPAIIGLLPMPGGAMMSAPMVRAMSDRVETPPEQNTLINYWFRHLWEYVWPLYPGVILTAALLEIPVRNVVAVNFPLTGAAILGGLLFCFQGIVRPEATHVRLALGKHVMQLIANLWPIVVVVVAVLFKVPLLLSLSVVCAVLLIAHRPDRGELREIARRSVTVETISLIFGVKVFQAVIDRSGAASQIVDSFVSVNVPQALLVFAVPFVIGVLTGLTLAFIGVTFPVLMPFFVSETGGVAYAYVMLAYAGGYIGVLFSPVHLCLVLTRDYFKADFGQIYMLLIRPALVVLAIAVGWFLFGVEPFVRGIGL